MKKSVGTLLVVISLLPFYQLALAQAPARQDPPDDDEVVRVESQEVKLDVVVKDKRGRPVKDLKATDFEVFEDGTRQQIQSFRFVTREEATASGSKSGGAPTTATTIPTGPSTPGIIALVFDRLSPEARHLARRAGLSYAQGGMAAGDFTGVFAIDQSLRTLQSFTDNAELVKGAIEMATGAAPSSYVSGAARVRDLAERSAALEQRAASSQAAASAAGAARDTASASAEGAAAGQAMIDQKFIEMETNMLERFRELERDQQGFATINGLLAVINPMRKLPGRKTLILFSEGLALPSSVMAKFPSVISAANRANVSIYTIDAAGLRIESGTAEAARELNSLAARRMAQAGRSADDTSGPYMKALEKNEDLLRLDPRSGLGTLANETGGFLIHDTNDLSTGLRRIGDDMRGYYLMTYVPRNSTYDGRFRQISVKLPRPDFEVQARKGYYAVESAGQFPVLDYEAPALAAARVALSAGSNPFPLRTGALSFPANGRAGTTLVLGEAALSSFTFAEGRDKKSYSAAVSVVVLVKDRAGRVVQKMSQHYPLTGPAEGLAAARKGELLFYRETQLPPGSYTVELIGYDASAGKASVRTSTLEVPADDESRPRLSSVSVLKRGERLTPEEQKQDRPFHFGGLLVYPNLGESISKSAVGQLAFFFTAWPARGAAESLPMTLEISQNGRRLFQTSGQLPAADERGQIKYASSFPLEKFPPGVYELKVSVGDGQKAVSRSTQFTVAP